MCTELGESTEGSLQRSTLRSEHVLCLKPLSHSGLRPESPRFATPNLASPLGSSAATKAVAEPNELVASRNPKLETAKAVKTHLVPLREHQRSARLSS